MPQITIDIDADASELKKQIAEAEIELKGLRKEMNRKFSLGETDAAEKIQLEVNQAKTALKGLQSELSKTSQSHGTLAKSTANGGNALMQFSRIAQDAPFGIMGIGNNITATAEAFGHLQKETGSTGSALKAVASSMLGSGGILLAVSLVTSALTYMSQNGITVKDLFDKMSGTFDEVGKSMNDAFAEASKNSASEITTMNAYVKVAQNVNLSMKDRLTAVDKLQEQYPGFLGNLSKEQILNGDVTDATLALTNAIIAKAKAQAFSNKIAELAEKSLKNDLEAAKIRKDLISLENQLAQAQNNRAAAQFGGATAEGAGIDGVNQRINEQRDNINDLIKANKENTRVMGIYTNEVYKATEAQIGLDTKKPSKGKGKKAEVKKAVIPFKSEIQATDLVDVQGIEVFNGQIDQFGNKIKELPGVIKTGMVVARNEFDYGSLAMIEAMYEFNKSANQLIQGAITNTFTSLGESIGGALSGAGDGLKSAGSAILGILGDFMKDYGELMISTGVGLLVAETALKSGNPFAMIAGGVALVAVGAAFANQSKAMQSKGLSGNSGGGSVSSNSGASQQSSGSSFASSGASSMSGGTVVFEIAGQKLIGVLNNTLDANRRIGGNISI